MKKIAIIAAGLVSVASAASAQSMAMGAAGSATLSAELIIAGLFAIAAAGALVSTTSTK